MGIGLLAQVLLARQMEQSVKDFAAWRKNREREVAQLRRQGRKQAAQVRPRPCLSSGVRNAQCTAYSFPAHELPDPAVAWPHGRQRCLHCLLRCLWPVRQGSDHTDD